MAEEITFQLDLVQQATKQLSFLKNVHVTPELHKPAVQSHAIYRYQHYWLPLAADYPDECLSAPRDIEWAWHCHMLAPQRYADDCERMVGSPINHTVRSRDEYEKALFTSEIYWQHKYGDRQEPFQCNLKRVEQGELVDLSSFLRGAMSRQRYFYYQVSLSHYLDERFLTAALERYKKFLYLKSKLPTQPVVPCFDIDLIWHTHQLHPAAYSADTRAVLGYLLNHDDDVGEERGTGSQLHKDTVDTAKHWQELFNEPFALAGPMHRGPSPKTYISSVWGNSHGPLSDVEVNRHGRFIRMGVKVTSVSIEYVFLKPYGLLYNKNLCDVRVYITSNTGDVFTGHLAARNDIGVFPVYFDKSLYFDTKNSGGTLEFQIELRHQGTRMICFRYDTSIAKYSYGCSLMKMISQLDSNDHKFSDSMYGYFFINGSFATSLKDTPALAFYLEEGTVSLGNASQLRIDIPTHWTFPLVYRSNREAEELYPHAIHRMRFGEDSDCILYSAEIIHVVSSGTFLVRIYQEHHVVAAAHLIGHDQLPRADQVDGGCVTLDPEKKERAILIKSSSGDWGLIKAGWKTHGTSQTEDLRESEKGFDRSNLEMTFYKLSSGQQSAFDFDEDLRYFRTNGVEVDLVNGEVKIDTAGAFEMAETLALAFSAGIMFMMCVQEPTPAHPPSSDDEQSLNPPLQTAQERDHTDKQNSNWQHWNFFCACAVGQTTLANHCPSVDLTQLCAVCTGYHSYVRPEAKRSVVQKARRREDEERKLAEERERERERERHERHFKTSAGMCLGCGPSGCRGNR